MKSQRRLHDHQISPHRSEARFQELWESDWMAQRFRTGGSVHLLHCLGSAGSVVGETFLDSAKVLRTLVHGPLL